MSSAKRTVHSKNVANFRKLISSCATFGSAFNPPKSSLQLSSLNAIRIDAEAKLHAVKPVKTIFDKLVKARLIAFRPIEPITKKIMKQLRNTGVVDDIIEDAKTIVSLIQSTKTTNIDIHAPRGKH